VETANEWKGFHHHHHQIKYLYYIKSNVPKETKKAITFLFKQTIVPTLVMGIGNIFKIDDRCINIDR
jgi:hypothetical protein